MELVSVVAQLKEAYDGADRVWNENGSTLNASETEERTEENDMTLY